MTAPRCVQVGDAWAEERSSSAEAKSHRSSKHNHHHHHHHRKKESFGEKFAGSFKESEGDRLRRAHTMREVGGKQRDFSQSFRHKSSRSSSPQRKVVDGGEREKTEDVIEVVSEQGSSRAEATDQPVRQAPKLQRAQTTGQVKGGSTSDNPLVNLGWGSFRVKLV